MPKRRHEEVSEDLDDTLPTEAAPKKTRFAAEVANEFGENGVPDKIEYWVVRKPKNIKASDLPTFRLPKRLPAEDKEVQRTDRENEFLNVKFSEVSKQMFYVNRENALTSSSGKKRMKPTSEIKGMIFMQPKDDESDVGHLPPEEDFLNPENCTESSEMPFKILKIRRRPFSGKSEPSERVKAFGSNFPSKSSLLATPRFLTSKNKKVGILPKKHQKINKIKKILDTKIAKCTMNPSKQQQTSSSTKKQPSSAQQTGKTNSTASTPNSRKPNQSQGRRPQQTGGQQNKKRNSPSYSNQMDFLSFQPALQECFQTPKQQYDNKRRASPRGGNNGNVISQSAKYSSQVNGYNNSLSPIKLASPAIAPIIRQGNNQQQSNSNRRQRGSPLALFKHTPFAGAKYLELPSTKDLPLPPAWLLVDGTTAQTSSNEASLSSSPISMIEPPSPTTEAAMKIAKENGFDGRVRIHPLQLIAAVSSC